MHKPQRQTSIGQRESLRGTFRRSSGISSKSTPLLRKSTRLPLSSVKTNRRESYIGTSSQHAVKDPRPLSDKSYIRRCVLELIQILGSLNYPTSLTPKMFNPPSTKEYQRVFEFLSYEVMGNFRMLGKPDEEMMKALKEFGYPYTISKSNLSNVGALSCWPHALGALMWLADLARYCSGLDDAIEETLSINTRNKLKLEFNSRCYDEFMTGNDGPYSEVESQLKAAIGELDADALKSLDELKVDYNKLAAEYDRKMQEKEACYNLVDDIQTKRDNIRKLRQYLSQCDEYIGAMKSKGEELKNNIAAREEEIELVNQKLLQLKSKVSQQEMSPADVENIIREKQQLRDGINAASERLEQLKAAKWDLDVLIGKHTLKADERATTFNNDFKSVSTSVELLKDHLPSELVDNVRASDFAVALGHKGNKDNEELLTKKIKPFQTSLNTKMFEIVGTHETELYNLRKRVKQDVEIFSDLNKEKEQLREQYEKLQKESEAQRTELKNSEETYNVKISKVETSLEQLKSVHSESVEDMVVKLNEVKERGKNLEENHSKIMDQKKNNLKQIASSVKRFQLTLHERVEKLKDSLVQIEEDALQSLQEANSHRVAFSKVVDRIEEFVNENK